jgi:hypothetical protein
VINELAVRAPFRRTGIGTRLHTALLHGLTAKRVTLTVRPEPAALTGSQVVIVSSTGTRRQARTVGRQLVVPDRRPWRGQVSPRLPKW